MKAVRSLCGEEKYEPEGLLRDAPELAALVGSHPMARQALAADWKQPLERMLHIAYYYDELKKMG